MPTLALSLLGPPLICLDDKPVKGFVYQKARALLAYLVYEADRPHTRDEIVGLLWPDLPDAAARTNLRQSLANLREVIGDAHVTPPFLHISRDSVQFDPQSKHNTDVIAFVRLLDACAKHAHRHADRCRSCAQRLAQAVALYRGDFLSGVLVADAGAFEEWLLLKREGLRSRALDALSLLATYHELRASYDQAQAAAARMVELDPLREEAHQLLMRVLALTGQRSAALEQYRHHCQILRDELGVEPALETVQLYERIRAGSFQAGETVSSARRLPVPPTSLVGRETEITELSALVENPACHLISVVGPGGIGKTRLAVSVATAMADTFVHGVTFASLDAPTSAEWLPTTIMQALRVPLAGHASPRTQLLSYLRDKELLLVLDGFEYLLDGVGLLSEILRGAPRVTLLITTRERLNLQAEWLFDVEGLTYPAPEITDSIETYSAVQLFTQRARQAHRNFDLAENARAVSRICHLVEGLPLAIELAAGVAVRHSCAQVAVELERNIHGLSTTIRDLPVRQRSVLATFEYSWRMLSVSEQQILSRLSVFRGAFSAEPAARIAQAAEHALAKLVDKSWLRMQGSDRFDIHALVRQFAGEQLQLSGEATDVRAAHLRFFCELGDAAYERLFGTEQQQWLTRLESAHDDVRAALSWAIEQGDRSSARRLAGAYGRFWEIRCYWYEGRQWLYRVLQLGASVDPSVEDRTWYARALTQAGSITWLQGDFALARELNEQSLSLYRALGDRLGMAHVLGTLGNIVHEQGDYATAGPLYEESLALYRALEDKMGIAALLFLLGLTAFDQRDPIAQRLFAESLSLRREIGEPRGISYSLNGMGNVAYMQRDYVRAQAFYEEALALRRKIGDKRGVAANLEYAGNIQLKQGNYIRARALYEESLKMHHELGDKRDMAHVLSGLARVALAGRQVQQSVKLLGAVQSILTTTNARLDEPAYSENEQTVAVLRAELDEATFSAAWEEGRRMVLENAVQYALDLNKPTKARHDESP